MRGRKPTPTAVLDLKGATKHNPGRYADRRDEPKPDGALPEPPDYFDDGRRAIWNELYGQIALGVVTIQDAMAFEVLVNMVAEYRRDPIRMSATKVMNLISMLARFGMTPSDRTRIKVAPVESDHNPFAEFKAEARSKIA